MTLELTHTRTDALTPTTVTIPVTTSYNPLTGERTTIDALIDAGDYALLSDFTWRLGNTRSDGAAEAVQTKARKDLQPLYGTGTLLMHRLILGLSAGDGIIVDHRDRNPLNNTRANLRIVTNAENASNARRRVDNTTGYKGVTLMSKKTKTSPPRYRARIVHNRQSISLGTYPTAYAAARAYDAAALHLFGEHAATNVALGYLGNPA